MLASRTEIAGLVGVGLASLALLCVACSSANGEGDGADSGAMRDTGSTGDASDALDAGEAGLSSDGVADADAGVVVTLAQGQLQGVVDGQTWSFRGIPYAAPPVGNLRWALPAPPAPWTGVRSASAFASNCVQISDGGIDGSEDCLYLNVWTPTTSLVGSHPVMFFTHGGGLSQGAGSDPLYEGADLAQHTDAVIVTINYRLGGLGFLAHADLSSENTPPTSGNYGVLDQLAALRWVKANIGSFGGDPGRVTIFGESAGATSTAIQVLSPLGKGLFEQAIVESTGIFPSLPDLTAAETAGAGIATSLGCSASSGTAACLRAVPAATVIAKTAVYDWTFPDLLVENLGYRLLPVVDDYLLAAQPFDSFKAGTHNHVPIILGNNATEAGYFAAMKQIPAVTSVATYTTAMNQLLGSNASAVLGQYPAASDSAAFDTYLTALTDGGFVCRTRTLARAILQGQSQPVYRYLFTDTLRGPQAIYGSFHTLELFFLFRTLGSYGYPTDSQDDAVSASLQRYWGNFATLASPNDSTAVPWPANDSSSDAYLSIGTSVQADAGLRTTACDFWDSLGLY
jgi:para-nitrobenzyl esterase